ncbi:unnamed protein product, partial [Musa textilis]
AISAAVSRTFCVFFGWLCREDLHSKKMVAPQELVGMAFSEMLLLLLSLLCVGSVFIPTC